MSKITMKCLVSAFRNTLFTFFFTILPFIFGLLSIILFRELNGLVPFYINGEFFLYAVSLIASSYVGLRLIRSTGKLFDGWPEYIALLLMIISSACYALILNSVMEPRQDVIKILSFVLLIAAVILSFYSQYVAHSAAPDIIQERKEEQRIIKDKLK